MSTRANIVIKEGNEQLWFYRHSDGYPEGTLPTLAKFLNYIKEGKIRADLGQAAGWLIIIGNEEYNGKGFGTDALERNDHSSWKVGAYEPTTGQHGDIDYLYTIDLDEKTVTYKKV